MATIDIKVPDIGDFKDVAVIEVLVKPGDSIKEEQSLITVESDKASMEIPAPEAGSLCRARRDAPSGRETRAAPRDRRASHRA